MRIGVAAVTVVLAAAGCGYGNESASEGDAVRISVDAKLESEVHDEESLTPVEGEIVATIGDPVALPD